MDTESISGEFSLVLEVPRQGIHLNVILRDFTTHDIFKMKLEPGGDLQLFLISLAGRLGSQVEILNAKGKWFFYYYYSLIDLN